MKILTHFTIAGLLRVLLVKGRSIPDVLPSFRGGYISEYFNVKTSFRTSFQESETSFQPEGSGFFEYFALKTSFKTGFLYLKPVYTRKFSKMQVERNVSGTSQDVPTLERATLFCIQNLLEAIFHVETLVLYLFVWLGKKNFVGSENLN